MLITEKITDEPEIPDKINKKLIEYLNKIKAGVSFQGSETPNLKSEDLFQYDLDYLYMKELG